MSTEQLYARGKPIFPETNYEKDQTPEKLQGIEWQLSQIQEAINIIVERVTNQLLEKMEIAEWAKQEVKPTYTAEEVGADEEGSAQGALEMAKGYSDATYQQATGYTDLKIAELINGAQGTLETLKQIADAMADNKAVVEALEAAIGNKASDVELQAHMSNGTVHITESERNEWNAGTQKLGGIEAGANRVTLTKSLLATVEGTALDAVAAPVLVEMINALKNDFANRISEINGNLQNKANLNGVNTFTDTLVVVSEKSLQSNNYSTGQFVSNAEMQINPNARAGYGFHNHGNNGIFLYLDSDGTLKYINNMGGIYQIQTARIN